MEARTAGSAWRSRRQPQVGLHERPVGLVAFPGRATQRAPLGGGESGRRLELLARLGSGLDSLGEIGFGVLVQQLVLAGLVQIEMDEVVRVGETGALTARHEAFRCGTPED